MKNSLKHTVAAMFLITAFGVQGMKFNITKNDMLKQISFITKLFPEYTKNLATNSSLTPVKIIMPDGSKETVLRGQCQTSEYFKTLFNLNSHLDHNSYTYTFNKETPLEAAKIIVEYLKDSGQYTEKAILESDYILDIYGLVNELQIKPLIYFLNDTILDVLSKKGLIGQLIDDVGIEEGKKTLDQYLCGKLNEVLKTYETNPHYFDWKNPTEITHKNSVNSATFSPCGRYIATASLDNTCKIYDLQTQRTIATITHNDLVRSASFSPDGRYIVTASNDRTCQLYDLQTQKTIATITHNNWVRSATFSPCGRYIVTASDDNTCQIYDLQTQRTIAIITHNNWVNSATFSPCGRYIVTASDDTTCQLYDLETQQTIATITHNNWVRSATFSPCGRYVVTASNDKTCKLYDLQTQRTIAIITHNDWVNSATFSPDGRYVVTASNDKTCQIYDLETQQTIATITRNMAVRSATFSPCGRYVVTASEDMTCQLYDLETQKISTIITHNNWVNSATFSPCGRYIVTASWDDTCKIFKALDKQEIMKKIIVESREFSTKTTNSTFNKSTENNKEITKEIVVKKEIINKNDDLDSCMRNAIASLKLDLTVHTKFAETFKRRGGTNLVFNTPKKSDYKNIDYTKIIKI